MPISTTVMILTSVGLQFFNNWRGNKLNADLQKKREEFDEAARERQTEHMLKIFHQGQEKTIELETENHLDNINKLKNDIADLARQYLYEDRIVSWPLKVLPFVMKNQALCNLMTHKEEKVAMHVIFTRSNFKEFNKLAYPIIENQLESYCNDYYSTISSHPIMFYSGGWKDRNNPPTGGQLRAMRESLSNLPTLVISPFYRPSDGRLAFQINMWGVGESSTDEFSILEFLPTNFQREFSKKDDYENEIGLLDELLEDCIPYLKCLIGYLCDTYFWSAFGTTPILPNLIHTGAINTDGMLYLVDDTKNYYRNLLVETKKGSHIFNSHYLLNLFEGSNLLWTDSEKKDLFQMIVDMHYNVDLSFVEHSLNIIKDNEWANDISQKLLHVKETISSACKPKFLIVKHDKLTLLELLKDGKNELIQNPSFDKFNIMIIPNRFLVASYFSDSYNGIVSPSIKVFVTKHFIMPRTKLQDINKLSFEKKCIDSNIFKLELIMTEKDLEKLFADSNDTHNSGVSPIFDAFAELYNRLKESVIAEFKRNQPQNNGVGTVPKHVSNRLIYEDFIAWIRQNSNKNPKFDGVFATIEKGGFFDSEKYMMYVCFTINKEPQLTENDPRVIFAFSKLDSALMDMFGNNTTIQININK